MVTKFLAIVPNVEQIRDAFGKLLPMVVLVVLVSPSITAAGDTGVPPARDPARAITEQFQLAESAPGNAALILFIGRYPDQPLTATARHILKDRPPDTAAGSNADGEIILAFDQARLTQSNLKQFKARYPGHPLAREAANGFWTADP